MVQIPGSQLPDFDRRRVTHPHFGGDDDADDDRQWDQQEHQTGHQHADAEGRTLEHIHSSPRQSEAGDGPP